MSKDKRIKVWAVCLITAVVLLVILLRPKPDSERALYDLANAAFSGRSLGCAKIANGTQLLSGSQSRVVIDEIVRPILDGATLSSVKTERRGPGHSSAMMLGKSKDGKPVFLALNAFELEDGGGIPLIMLLLHSWQVPYLKEHGSYPTDPHAFDKVYVSGMRSAAPVLRKAGVSSIFGPEGRFVTIEELQEYFEKKLAEHDEL